MNTEQIRTQANWQRLSFATVQAQAKENEKKSQDITADCVAFLMAGGVVEVLDDDNKVVGTRKVVQHPVYGR